MKKCNEVMTKSPVYCLPSDAVSKVAQLMKSKDIGAVPIIENEQTKKLVGIVTDRDLALKIVADGRDPKSTKAVEVMTREVVALPERADAAEAGRLMLERGIKSIPVVRERRVVGIVARRDLLKMLARGDEDIAVDLRALLEEELGPPSPYRVAVRDGVVELTGPPDPTARRLATLLVRGVPGVIDVRFAEE